MLSSSVGRVAREPIRCDMLQVFKMIARRPTLHDVKSHLICCLVNYVQIKACKSKLSSDK